MAVSRAAGPTSKTNATKHRERQERAQRVLRLVLFLVLILFLAVSGEGVVSAQQASPTPEIPGGTPLGTQTLIPEIPTQSPIEFTYPVHGLKVTGVVNITGAIGLSGWTRYELAFAFADNKNDNWFVFASGSFPLNGSALGSWKTTTISDGDYNLRLRVYLPGSSQDGFVYGLRVRNYTLDTPVPTLTLTPTATSAASATPTTPPLPSATVTPTLTVFPTPTALPPNPAIIDNSEILFNLGRGALLTVALFGIFGLLLRLRQR